MSKLPAPYRYRYTWAQAAADTFWWPHLFSWALSVGLGAFAWVSTVLLGSPVNPLWTGGVAFSAAFLTELVTRKRLGPVRQMEEDLAQLHRRLEALEEENMALRDPDPLKVYARRVVCDVEGTEATAFTLTVANDSEAQAKGVSVQVTIDWGGSSATQQRRLDIPPRQTAELRVVERFRLDEGTLTVSGAVAHNGFDQPFCFRYERRVAEFVPCADSLRSHYVLKVHNSLHGHTAQTPELVPGEHGEEEA